MRIVCCTMYLLLGCRAVPRPDGLVAPVQLFCRSGDGDHGLLRPQNSALCREIHRDIFNECLCSACADASWPQELQREAEELVGAEGGNVEEVGAQKPLNECALAATRRTFSAHWVVFSSTLEAAFMEH